MHVAFDAVMLSAYLHPAAKYPYPVSDVPARVDILIEELEAAGAKIIIATPVLSEFLVMAGPIDGPVYLSELTNSDVFDVKPFDVLAATEAAEMHRKAQAAGDKKAGNKSRWQVVKVDRQLVAIAKVNGVVCIYSDDDGVRKMAASAGIAAKGMRDLPLPPPDDPQGILFPADHDAAVMRTSEASAPGAPSQPDAQSHGDATRREPSLEQSRRAIRQRDAKPRQRGSSQPGGQSSRSKK
jgi:hypothetical protein